MVVQFPRIIWESRQGKFEKGYIERITEGMFFIDSSFLVLDNDRRLSEELERLSKLREFLKQHPTLYTTGEVETEVRQHLKIMRSLRLVDSYFNDHLTFLEDMLKEVVIVQPNPEIYKLVGRPMKFQGVLGTALDTDRKLVSAAIDMCLRGSKSYIGSRDEDFYWIVLSSDQKVQERYAGKLILGQYGSIYHFVPPKRVVNLNSEF